VVLSSSADNGNQWYMNGVPVADSNKTYTISQPAHYQLTLRQGCFTSDTADVTFTNAPTTFKPVISMNGVQLISSYGYGNQWYQGSNLITGATNTTYVAKTVGSYFVTVPDPFCGGTVASDPVNVVITSANSPALEKNIQVGPNPALNTLYIKYNGTPATLLITLIDQHGKQVYKEYFNGSLSVDMSGLPTGMYIVEISNQRTKERMTTKIVKE
jgi:large repetitive protein